jgi:hypothetical protein
MGVESDEPREVDGRRSDPGPVSPVDQDHAVAVEPRVAETQITVDQ